MRYLRFFPLPALLIAGLAAGMAQAQPVPFDMSPERPVLQSLPERVMPQIMQHAPPPAPPKPSPSLEADSTQKPADNSEASRVERRFIVPMSSLTLSGEFAQRSWSIYLTEQEAAVPVSLSIAYRNSIVIAPEASKLFVFLNGRKLSEEPIAASDAVRQITLDVPADMLQPGANRIEIRADQRHRTDCDVRSTYDLWTEIDPGQTYLSFKSRPIQTPSVAEAVRAIGVDPTGQTQFHIVMPSLGQPAAVLPLLRLSQGLSLMAGMPSQIFTFSQSAVEAPSAGKMEVVIGTASDLQPHFSWLPGAAQSVGFAALAVDPNSGQNILLISGPTWGDIRNAIESLVAPLDRVPGVRRDVITTQRWNAPDAPLLFGGERISLSQLGVDTIEFSGRRVRTAFNIAVPADFYANAYGEAKLMLDAAFASSVLPGSHVDVYVNGNIAATVPITSNKGGIFRHLPVKVALRHIKPGVNKIELEAIILTQDDTVCAPGATASTEPRMAIFNTSEWQMPVFARISQNPNLSALAGTALPYGRMPEPLTVSMERFDTDTMGAATTFMAKLAMMAGQPIATELLASINAIGERNAIFFGSASQMPPKLLSQVNLSADIAAAWRPLSDTAAQSTETSQAFDKWRSRVSGGVWSGQISAFQEWLRRNFDLSSSSLQFFPGAEIPFTPSANQSLVVAQGYSPEGRASWTVVTAPTIADLRQGVTSLIRQDRWTEIGGRATAISTKTDEMQVIAATDVEFVHTGPNSIANYRLVLANWLSTNVLFYAILLVVFTVLFGLMTATVLRRLGRGE